MQPNPFNPLFPAQRGLFANRRDEQHRFRRSLDASTAPESPGPWNVALLGPWGIGKTSLLRRFTQLAETHEPALGVVTLSVTSAVGSIDGFCETLLQRIRSDLSAQMGLAERVRAEVDRWQPRLSVGPVSASRPPDRGAGAAAGRGVDQLYSELGRLWVRLSRCDLAGVLIFLDDIENLLAAEPSALLTLRSVFQDLQGRGCVFPLVITGPATLLDVGRDVSEPVTRFFDRMPLASFTLADTLEAIREPLRLNGATLAVADSAAARLWEKTGGHPYFVSFVMRELVDQAYAHDVQVIDAHWVDTLWPGVLGRLSSDRFELEWQACTAAERDVLRLVAAGTPSLGRSGPSLASRLVSKGLLVRPARGVYALYHPLFRDYVLAPPPS